MSQRIPWDVRIERAELLRGQKASVAQLLGFYAGLLRLQKSVYEQLTLSGKPEMDALAAQGPALLKLVKTSAPEKMAAMACGLEGNDWNALLTQQWSARMNGSEWAPNFFLDALLQPYAEALAWEPPDFSGPRCPFCNSLPQLAVMRPEGDGAKRNLYCGLCGTEWAYRRLKCVNCGEEDKEKLPNFKSEHFDHIYLTACDTCKTYVKCIDLSVDGNAVPPVDDLASVPMSLWAVEQHYQPATPNLFGL